MLATARDEVRAFVARLRGRTDDESALPRIQAYFYLSWLANLAATAGLLFAAPPATTMMRPGGAAGLACLAWRRHRAYRRGRESSWDWPVDAAALTVALPAVTANQATGLLFGATVAQVVFGIRGRWWLTVVGAGTAFAASEWLRGGSHEDVPGTLFGLIAISTLVATLLRVTLTHEGRIRRQRTALERERELLGAVLESVDTGVLATDGDNRVILINRALRELNGLPDVHAEDLRDHATILLTDVDGVALTPETLPTTRVLAGEHVRNLELRVQRPDGEERVVVVNARAVRGPAEEALGAVVAVHDVTAARRAESALVHHARHDSLTGLANRAELARRLGDALDDRRRTGQPLTLLFIDLDDFKDINDTLGHAAGDEVLVAVADRLRAHVRPDDLPVRLGGDEFAVLLPHTGPEQALAVADRLLHALGSPLGSRLGIGGPRQPLGVSIGIADAGSGADTAADLLRNADLAMYAAKRAGKQRWALFTPDLLAAVAERTRLETDLRHALRDARFELHYQPLVRVGDGAWHGVEALLRWRDRKRGMVSPATFVPAAEASGLIVPLGAWVLDEACRQARVWADALGRAAPTVSVNVSPRQLLEPGFPELVRRTAHRHRLDPADVVLEITESALEGDGGEVLRALRRGGFTLALDDFGAGYSSLGRLREFPVDLVKIDRGFVADDSPVGRAVVQAAVTLAHGLGAQVVAEGVETIAQQERLRRLGCDLMQGYLIARPMPAAVVSPLLLSTRAVG